jgi:hypothetical protein
LNASTAKDLICTYNALSALSLLMGPTRITRIATEKLAGSVIDLVTLRRTALLPFARIVEKRVT